MYEEGEKVTGVLWNDWVYTTAVLGVTKEMDGHFSLG